MYSLKYLLYKKNGSLSLTNIMCNFKFNCRTVTNYLTADINSILSQQNSMQQINSFHVYLERDV